MTNDEVQTVLQQQIDLVNRITDSLSGQIEALEALHRITNQRIDLLNERIDSLMGRGDSLDEALTRLENGQ
jgi:chromosome segregation ATPase